MHEGGWKIRFDDAGNVVVTNPAGNVIPPLPAASVAVGGIEQRNQDAGIAIESRTVTPTWYGDALDLDHITTALWCVDQRDRPSRN